MTSGPASSTMCTCSHLDMLPVHGDALNLSTRASGPRAGHPVALPHQHGPRPPAASEPVTSGHVVIVESLSKFPVVFVIHSKTADEISRHLFSFIAMFGPPAEIISDQGSEFVNQVVTVPRCAPALVLSDASRRRTTRAPMVS
eukprot:m.3996 g.3996  ORF g.3996 m.3996 type:complete len:143 (-) comp1696_c0_seq1:25-453(-)